MKNFLHCRSLKWFYFVLQQRPLLVNLLYILQIIIIGYGNISPSLDNTTSMIFTIFFALFGIPFCMLTLANMARYFIRTYWMMQIFLGRVKFFNYNSNELFLKHLHKTQ